MMRLSKLLKMWYITNLSIIGFLMTIIGCKVAEYWNNRPWATRANDLNGSPSPPGSLQEGLESLLSKYDWHHQMLISEEVDEEWAAELQHYLKEVSTDITRETDIIKWWSVSYIYKLTTIQ